MRATSLRRLLVPALATIVLAAGCGGDDGNGGSTSPTEWADSLCTATMDWTDSLQSTADTLRSGNLSEESLRSAADDVKSSTSTFVDDVKGLGRPDTESGQRAEELTDGLGDDLDQGAQKIEDTVEDVSDASGVLNAVTVVSGTIQTMSQQVSSTLQQLKQLDPAGELAQGFEDAESCDQLEDTGG
jgi:ABC-type transporter Mla subunit MlaD